jgi:hypothetical protein
MKGQVTNPEVGKKYWYVDLMAYDVAQLYGYYGSEIDHVISNRGLIFHDEQSAKECAEKIINFLQTITE